ncbi:exosortase A [Rhizorhapis sp. SPR117]|uniref:exosortase A n=1 Tax=Rhizorhapis sp. SPR117 TaxID=2912611 RepID=UPI001F00525F|nr:exosortase A [Rhizorhapis sp. SPR117]
MNLSAVMSKRSFVLQPGWPTHLVGLALVAAMFLLLFAGDVADIVSIWWNVSTFGHCLLIPLILFWLVEQRLHELRQLTPVAWWPGLIWAAAGAFCWLLGDAASVALARHLGLVVMLQGAVITMLGPQVSRGLAFPIFYALFLVPFGEEFVPVLQTITAHLSMLFLDWSGIPAHLSGVFITTPSGYFEVAEACSGAKFLIAMAAYAALVCNVCFKSWSRRIAFMSAALVIAVIANGVRAFGTIYIADRISIDFATSFDHVIYGWIFFAIILALVMTMGWPLFDRRAHEAFLDPHKLQGRVRYAGRIGVIAPSLMAVAVAAPLWSFAMVAASDPVPTRISLPEIQGWTRVDYRPAYPWRPRFAGADHEVMGRYRNSQGQEADLAIAVYARQQEGQELVGFGQGAIDPDSKWVWSAPALAPAEASGEHIVAPGPVNRDVVSFYSIDGVVTGNATRVKLQTLKARLLGGDQRAAAVLISAEDREGYPAQAAIRAFLRDIGPIGPIADRSTGKN